MIMKLIYYGYDTTLISQCFINFIIINFIKIIIFLIFFVIAEQCKSEWTKLRNCFLNAIRRRRNKTSGQATKNIPPWRFSQQMEFILPFLENRE